MDPILHDNLRPQKFTEHELDKLLQDLNDFETTVSMQGPPGGIMDLLDSFLPNGNDNPIPQKFTEHQLDKLLHDLNEFQRMQGPHGIMDLVDSFFTHNIDHLTKLPHDSEIRMLSPCQRDSTATNNLNNDGHTFAFATETQDSQMIIEGTQDLIMETSHDSPLSIDLTFDDLNFCHLEGTGGFEINSFTGTPNGFCFDVSGTTSFGASSVRYFRCKENSSRNEKADIPRKKKRKYRGVIQTEEETARRLYLTKIKNREAAAKAHQKKRDYEANLKRKLLRLRKKNQFLKNFLMFLEDDKRKGSSPMPLRRTISGPM